MLPQQPQQPPQPFQRGFLNCFFWCGGPSGNVVDEDEDEEGLAVGLPDVSRGVAPCVQLAASVYVCRFQVGTGDGGHLLHRVNDHNEDVLF